MIKNALSVLPTRPVMYIVPAVVALVMFFYYLNLYTNCTNNQEFRTSLNRLLHAADRPAQFRLEDFTDFQWDRVRVVNNFKPEKRDIQCPFGWNWSNIEREKLIAANLLTVLIFAREGTIVEYIELRSDEVAFKGSGSSLTPDTALFDVGVNSGNHSEVTLTLIE